MAWRPWLAPGHVALGLPQFWVHTDLYASGALTWLTKIGTIKWFIRAQLFWERVSLD